MRITASKTVAAALPLKLTLSMLLLTQAVGLPYRSHAADYVVSPIGSDQNPGTGEKPLATLAGARDLLRRSGKLGKEAITVNVLPGTYYLNETLVFTTEDSGTEEAPVVWKSADPDKARLVGGSPLRLAWELHKGPVFRAQVPEGTVIDQFFLNGARQILARYPNYDPALRPFCGFARTAERMKTWKNPGTAYIHGIADPRWGGAHSVYKRNATSEWYEYMVSIDTTTPGNQGSISQTARFAENVFEELDAPKEWFFDTESRTLYFQPENPNDLKNGLFEAVGNPHLIRFQGVAGEPVKYLSFDGFLFSGAAPTWKQTQDHLPNGDFVVHRGAAFTFDGTEHCAVRNCSFVELGGNAVLINGYNRHASVEDCLIQNVGANGIALCGAADAMRGEKFFKVLDETITVKGVVRQKWENPKGWYELPKDMEPGPKTVNYPAECLIKGNLITLAGEIEKQGAGILLSMTRDNTISWNTIHNVPRAGIVMNDGAWSGNVIEHNDVFNTVRETTDHGPFNSWGRERYWRWTNHSGGHREPEKLQKYCLIDAMNPNHIRNNRFAHLNGIGHSWGIDLDDGSTNFRIYNNLTLGCGIKVREGMYRVMENNILIGDGKNVTGRHLCMPDNHDVFRRNIVINASRDLVFHSIRANMATMKESDFNCFFVPGGVPKLSMEAKKELSLREFQEQFKVDLHSIVADPMFVDPVHGDYAVKPESPVLKLGFKNFPMEFGVTAPRLVKLLPERTFIDLYGMKKQGETAEPQAGDSKRSDRKESLLGCEVKNMTEEEELTVVGIGEMTGVFVLTVPEGSPLARAGLRVNDLIIACNGRKVHDYARLKAIVDKVKAGSPIELQMHDDSGKRKITIVKE
jgi:parallel beta-helix repeat protein